MLDLSAEYMQKCTAATRTISFLYMFYPASGSGTLHINGDDVYSVKITTGKTTGGFGIGNSISSVLAMSVSKSMQVSVGDNIRIEVCFDGVIASSDWSQHEWVDLGLFYIDSVRRTDNAINITGLDWIVKLEKNYKSALTYPAKCSDVLAEISSQTGFAIADDFCAVNDAVITKEPFVEDGEGNKSYYTRRQIVEFIAAINGGNAYFGVTGYKDDDFHAANWGIKRYSPEIVAYTIQPANVIKQTLDDTTFAVTNVVWNKSGVSAGLDDDSPEGTIEFSVPLEFEDEDTILANIKAKLVGVTYSGVTLQKQGTGIFELGNLVQYQPLTGDALPVLVMGITYSIADGAFTETIYSLAKTATQQAYSGATSGATISESKGSGGGVGKASSWDNTSEYFNNYTGANIAGVEGRTGLYAHTEGLNNKALEFCTHVEGFGITVTGQFGHGEGNGHTVSGQFGHVEGLANNSSGMSSHVEGQNNTETGVVNHVEGSGNRIRNGSQYCHIEGQSNYLESNSSYQAVHIEGIANSISGTDGGSCIHIEGNGNRARGTAAHVEGIHVTVNGHAVHGEGYDNNVSGSEVHGEGRSNKIDNSNYSHIENYYNKITGGSADHAEGENNTIKDDAVSSHVEGEWNTVSGGNANHAQGFWNTVTGGTGNYVGGEYCLITEGHSSFAHGQSLDVSATENVSTKAAFGEYNDNADGLIFMVGNGTDDSDRSNAFAVSKKGDAYVLNDLYIKGKKLELDAIYKPKGSAAFADLPAVSSVTADYVGYVYNVSDAFVTTDDFVEGAGKDYPVGTNVVIVEQSEGVYKYDCLSGAVDLSDYYTKKQVDKKLSDVNDDIPFNASISVPVTAWSEDADSGFSYSASVAVADILSTDSARVDFDKASIRAASEAGIYSGDVLDGEIVLRAEKIPTQALTGVCVVTRKGIA